MGFYLEYELKDAFEKIQEKYFQEGFFMEWGDEGRKISFGDREKNYYTLHMVTWGYFLLYAFRFNTCKEEQKEILDIIAEELGKHEVDAFLSGVETIATGEKSEYVKDIMDYLDLAIFQNRDLRLPLYSAVPSVGENQVYLMGDNRKHEKTFRSVIEAKNFCESEKRELGQMMKTEKAIHDFILGNIPDVRVIKNPNDAGTPLYLTENFDLKCSFRKQKDGFKATFTLGGEWKNIFHSSLENVLEKTKKEIEEYVSKNISAC